MDAGCLALLRRLTRREGIRLSDPVGYLRLRRLAPLAIAHTLMDGASVLIGVLLPLVKA